MPLTLYGAARSRASMVRWYLAERQLPYRWELLDLAAGAQKQPAFLAINPFGKVPALVDDSLPGPDGQPLRLSESGAILLHLAERHGREFEGQGGEARRALSTQWVLFANASLGPALMAAATGRPEQLQGLLTVLDGLSTAGGRLLDPPGTLSAGPWGAADVAVGAYLAYLPLFCPQVDLTPWPAIEIRIAAVQQRPAYQQAMNTAA
ncbi:MAG: glutathione S-transferase family protein [Cyanobium sp.]